MGFLDKILRRNSELESLFDLDILIDDAQKIYLKKLALETCANFLGRTIAQSDFRIMKGKERIRDDWHYLLNVRPNTDQNASEFWQRVVRELVYENEALVILTDSNDLVVADSYYRDEFALYPDIFKDVTIKDYTFQRSFSMDEVIFLTYNNEKLSNYMRQLFDDCASLYARMHDVLQRNNQIRATVAVEGTSELDTKTATKLQAYMDKLYSAFKKNSVAVIPELKGFKYTEVNASKGSNSNISVDELKKIKRDIIDDAAKAIGIPPSLIHGEMADLDNNMKAYIKFCVNPLNKKIKDELNAKLFSKTEVLNENKRVEVFGVMHKSAIENSEAVDKLVASGAYTRNEVREKFGDERSDNPALDEFVITKNYESVSVGGGEMSED